MSAHMSVDKQRFEQLENTVIDIDKRMMPIELAVPSIDKSLKELVKISHQQQVNQAVQSEKNDRQEERNKLHDERYQRMEQRVNTNEKKLIKITLAISFAAVLIANAVPEAKFILSLIK